MSFVQPSNSTSSWKSYNGKKCKRELTFTVFCCTLKFRLGGRRKKREKKTPRLKCSYEKRKIWLLKSSKVFPDGSAGKESACNADDPHSIPGSGRPTGERIGYPLQDFWASLVAQLIKNPLAIWETRVPSLGWEEALEKGKATHSSILVWRIPWTAARQASLSFTVSQSLLKLTSTESVTPSKHLILCRPLVFQPSIFPSIRVFSKESVLCLRLSKYWSFSFSISPSNEYSALISFRIGYFDTPAQDLCPAIRSLYLISKILACE